MIEKFSGISLRREERTRDGRETKREVDKYERERHSIETSPSPFYAVNILFCPSYF